MARDIFNDDAFTLTSLTKGINTGPRMPTLLGSMGYFHEDGIQTTTFLLEGRDGLISLLPDQSRGAPSPVHESAKRYQLRAQCAHFVERDRIYADSAQDVREFDGTQAETAYSIRDRKLAEMRRNHDATLEHQRIGALRGLVVDKDGKVLFDCFAEFGVTQQTVDLDLGTSTVSVANKLVEAARKAEDTLGMRPSQYVVLAGPTLMDALRVHPSYQSAVAGWSMSSTQLSDHRFGDLVVGGCVFMEYRNPVAGPVYLPADEGLLLPLGVPDLAITRFAPADYVETANTIGLPYYAKGEVGPMARWIDIESQSNPISLVTRPAAIVRLTA